MAASPRRRGTRRQARTPGRPRSAGLSGELARHCRAPAKARPWMAGRADNPGTATCRTSQRRPCADRRGCVGGAGGLAQARSPARAAAAARNALSLAAARQPRTQAISGMVETWRSRASALLQMKQRRETLCRLRQRHTPHARRRRQDRNVAVALRAALLQRRPRAQDARGKIETWRSRASALLRDAAARDALSVATTTRPRKARAAAGAKRSGRAHARPPKAERNDTTPAWPIRSRPPVARGDAGMPRPRRRLRAAPCPPAAPSPPSAPRVRC